MCPPPPYFESLEELEEIIARFHQLSPCEGITEQRICEIKEMQTTKGRVPCIKRQGVLYSARCLGLVEEGHNCRDVRKLKNEGYSEEICSGEHNCVC